MTFSRRRRQAWVLFLIIQTRLKICLDLRELILMLNLRVRDNNARRLKKILRKSLKKCTSKTSMKRKKSRWKTDCLKITSRRWKKMTLDYLQKWSLLIVKAIAAILQVSVKFLSTKMRKDSLKLKVLLLLHQFNVMKTFIRVNINWKKERQLLIALRFLTIEQIQSTYSQSMFSKTCWQIKPNLTNQIVFKSTQ